MNTRNSGAAKRGTKSTGLYGKAPVGGYGQSRQKIQPPYPRNEDKMEAEEENLIVAAPQQQQPTMSKEDRWAAIKTPENRETARQVQTLLYETVIQITRDFHIDQTKEAPMFLWQFYGAYVIKSTHEVVWTAEMEKFWVNDNKTAIALWNLTDGQVRLRYAMLKEFCVQATLSLQNNGFPGITVLVASEILWPTIHQF